MTKQLLCILYLECIDSPTLQALSNKIKKKDISVPLGSRTFSQSNQCTELRKAGEGALKLPETMCKMLCL